MRYNDANKTTPPPHLPLAPSAICVILIILVKSIVLNILILSNLIVEWTEGVIKEGTDVLHEIYRFRLAVKSWGE